MRSVFINHYVKVRNQPAPFFWTDEFEVIRESDTSVTIKPATRLITLSKKRLDSGKRYRTPFDGYYFSDKQLARRQAAHKLHVGDYQLAGRLVCDLQPYVKDVAAGLIEPGTHEEEYHLWGRTVKATMDELVRIFDELNAIGYPPEGFTMDRLTLWLSVLGYTEKDYPIVFIKPINLFISDLELLDKLTGSKEGMTTKEYDEKRRYVFRELIKSATEGMAF